MKLVASIATKFEVAPGGHLIHALWVSSRYGQYCPVSLATEILGERWTLLIVSSLLDGVTRFGDLQRALPRISPSVLSGRLQTLEDAGIVRKRAGRNGPTYGVTEAGEELRPIVMGLGTWGQRWARDLEADDLDPLYLAWSMHLRMNVEALPPGRTVIEFEFTGSPSGFSRFWIVSNDGRIDLCVQHPGHETDLRVQAEIRRFVDAWRGFRSLPAEIRAGRIRLEGPPRLRRAFPEWLLLSALSQVERKRPGRERSLLRRRA